MTPWSLARDAVLIGLGLTARATMLVLGATTSLPAYEGATQGRRSLGFGSSYGPNRALAGTADTLRTRSHDLLRRNAYVRRGMASVVANLVGTGITPQSQVEDERLWSLIHERWDEWVRDADANGVQDYYGLQKLVTRTRKVGGECFVRRRPRLPEDGLVVPLQLQVLEPEFCPISHTGEHGQNRITCGIEVTPFGRIAAYWMHRVHPQDATLDTRGNELVRVSASEILHIFDPVRPGQMRGEPDMATAILPAHDFDRYDDATLQRALTGASVSGVIKRNPLLENQLPPGVTADTTVDATTGEVTQTWEPGTLFELREGEDIAFPPMPDLGANYGLFQKRQLQKLAAAIGNLYEHVSGDYEGITFSSVRAAINDLRQQWDQDQWTVQIPMFDDKVWRWWFDAAVLAGAFLPLVDGRRFLRERTALTRVTWVPPKRPYVNPLEDVQTEREEVEAGFSSISEKIRARGEDPKAVAKQRAADRTLFPDVAQPAVRPLTESTGQRAQRDEQLRRVK